MVNDQDGGSVDEFEGVQFETRKNAEEKRSLVGRSVTPGDLGEKREQDIHSSPREANDQDGGDAGDVEGFQLVQVDRRKSAKEKWSLIRRSVITSEASGKLGKQDIGDVMREADRANREVFLLLLKGVAHETNPPAHAHIRALARVHPRSA